MSQQCQQCGGHHGIAERCKTVFDDARPYRAGSVAIVCKVCDHWDRERCGCAMICPRCGKPGTIRNNAENLCDSCVEVKR